MVSFRCFHGTSYQNGMSILAENHFRSSDSDALRMGVGAYFFCQAGTNDAYPIMCARELERYHYTNGKHTDGYAILSCTVECDEDKFFDLYDPNVLEYFHQMRYLLLNKSLKERPGFKYKNGAVADTQVFDVIRKLQHVGVIRCPQYFGMFEEESKFVFERGEKQFPKTFVPNVIMVCVDTNWAKIKDIELIQSEVYKNEHSGIV